MKKKAILIPLAFLIITVSNYVTIIQKGHIRTVEFISILAIGIVLGILATQIFTALRAKKP